MPINHLMEDVATAEISRAQVWQWIKHPKGILADGRKVDVALFTRILHEELLKIKNDLGEQAYQSSQFDLASELFSKMTVSAQFEDFLTIPGYQYL